MVRLITGAAGMMGSHLYEALKDEDMDVVATYHNSTLDESETITQEMVKMDILDYECVKEVLSKYKPNVIYHLAAQSRPDVSFTNPALTIDTNVMGTLTLLQACVELGNECLFINASSSAVYGEIDWDTPPQETSICKPLSPYGTSKLAQEHIVRNFHQIYGDNINYVNVRIFNCTGPRKTNDMVSDVCKRIVTNPVKGKDAKVKVGNLDGVRSLVDVRDLVKGLILCEKQVLYSKNETINLAGDYMYRIREVFGLITNFAMSDTDDELVRPTDEQIIVGNPNKAKELLGWEPEISLHDTIFDTLEYWRTVIHGENIIRRFTRPIRRMLFAKRDMHGRRVLVKEKCSCCGNVKPERKLIREEIEQVAENRKKKKAGGMVVVD